jgi:hypothetical protein
MARLDDTTPKSAAGAVAIILIWIALAAGTGWLAWRWVSP